MRFVRNWHCGIPELGGAAALDPAFGSAHVRGPSGCMSGGSVWPGPGQDHDGLQVGPVTLAESTESAWPESLAGFGGYPEPEVKTSKNLAFMR